MQLSISFFDIASTTFENLGVISYLADTFTEDFDNASWLAAVIVCFFYEACSTAAHFYGFIKASIPKYYCHTKITPNFFVNI